MCCYLAIAISVCLFSIASMGLFRFPKFPIKPPDTYYDESFSAVPVYSLDDLVFEAKRNSRDDSTFVVNLHNLITRRFYFGYCKHTIFTNYFSVLGGYFYYGLNGVMDPDLILKYSPYALCSQQAMVFLEALRKVNIPRKKILLNNHYVLSVFFNNSWHYSDPTMEVIPIYQKRWLSTDELMQDTTFLIQLYSNSPAKINYAKIKDIFYEHPIIKKEIKQSSLGLGYYFETMGFYMQFIFPVMLFSLSVFILKKKKHSRKFRELHHGLYERSCSF